ncbi:MAG: hypothetical protein JWL90_214 [Chthoniobacteraceae bacterium]|nr:hypothetical protein [Chthoniobacteraceae bacterium]
MNTKNQPVSSTDALIEEGTHMKEDVQAYAKEAWENVQDQTGRAVREGSLYVRENPVPTALAAFGLGLIVGLVLSHREEPSMKKRYIDEPIDRSHGALLGLVATLSSLLTKNIHSASNAAEDFSDNVGDTWKKNFEPFADAARRAGRKLGL